MNSAREIKIGGIISYLTIAFSVISGLLYTPWMISIIGQADFGLFTLATSLVTLVSIDLGLSAAVTRFVSKYKAEKDEASIAKFLGIIYKIFIGLSIVLLFLLMLVYFNVDQIFLKLNASEISKIKILLIIAGLFAVFSFPFQPIDGLFFSGEKFIFLKSITLISKILNVALMVFALLAGYGLFALVVVNAVVGLLVIAFKLYFLQKKKMQTVNWEFSEKSLLKEIFSFSIWVMVISIAQRFILNVTPSILGVTSGTKEIAVFSAAMTIEAYIWTFATAFSGMFLPKVAQLIYGEKANPKAIQELMIKVGRIQFVMLGAIVSIFIVSGKDFFLNWLGASFEKSYIITVFLILPGLIIVPQEIASTALVASNKVKYNAYSKIIIAVLAIVLSYLFSSSLGAYGSGLAIFVGNMIGGVLVLNIIYVKVLKIDIWNFFRECQLRMILPLIIVLVLGVVLNIFFQEISWMYLIIKVLILGSIYTFSAYFFALNYYEKQLILGFLRRKII